MNKVISEIWGMDNDSLNKVIEAVKARRAELIARAAFGMDVGARVSFVSRRRGRIVGKITKINRKTVKVLADSGTLWTVTPTLLKMEK